MLLYSFGVMLKEVIDLYIFCGSIHRVSPPHPFIVSRYPNRELVGNSNHRIAPPIVDAPLSDSVKIVSVSDDNKSITSRWTQQSPVSVF